MKKLKLDLEDLQVASFEVAAAEEQKGTVQGAEGTDLCTYTCGDPFSALYRYYRQWTTTA